ncbi:MAG TPA: FAD-binding protein [Candidatus Saccharimonadales bacterium]|nr:FAD-binding protein [Candidatus Saccharimonadales bacterium]
MNREHTARVRKIASIIRRYHHQNVPFRVYHGSTNTTRTLRFDKQATVDVSQLNHILSINKKRQVVVVEANVSMDRLVEATLQEDMIPPVVMEFPGITVGGGIQGGAGESSSFEWGCFNRIVNWYEMILANGEIVRVSPEEKRDLFWGSAGSCGSIGVITAAEIQLIPAQPYVTLTYLPVKSFGEAISVTLKVSKEKHDFVDGILFAKDSGVVMVGSLAGSPARTVRRFTRAHDQWFYLHALKMAQSTTIESVSIPIRDYLFRYDRGAFWMGAYAYRRAGVPFNRASRYLLNPLMKTRKMYEALQASGVSQEYVVQDLAIPAETSVDFLRFVDKTFHAYPLWLCPLKVDRNSPLQANHLKTRGIINVGVWAPYRRPYEEFVAVNRKLEKAVRDHGGRKWLYAHAYYTEDEFWQIYDRGWYDKLRAKYHATSLPSLYDKTSRMRPERDVSFKRGVWKAITSKASLRPR